MLTLKLQRVGKKHQASFRLIVGEKRHKLVGKQTEYLGWYSPISDKMEFNKERVLHWLKVGAQKTDTVHNLLITAGIIEGKKIPVHKKSKRAPVAVPAAEIPAVSLTPAA
ncbi:MAG: 30S ribosomal protein S16 [Patescibacteria group bacterium]